MDEQLTEKFFDILHEELGEDPVSLILMAELPYSSTVPRIWF